MAIGTRKPSPNVAYKREELEAKLPEYQRIADAVAGSPAIKKKREKYLPRPNPTDRSPANLARYNAYIERAVFYGATNRTLRGLVGQVYLREPMIEVPNSLDVLIENANGEGLSIAQLAMQVTAWVMSFGRAGLFVDYPKTEGDVTREDLETGGIRPVIKSYRPEQIINWRVRARGSLVVLCLIVLEEDYIVADDGFEAKKETQWRVLRLRDDDVYTVEVWRKNAERSYYIAEPAQTVLDASGLPFDLIPFSFIGAENNDSDPDAPPMFDLADLNIAHYRNSADHEENLYFSAQATVVISGLTEQWANKYFKEGVPLGGRSAITLPVGGNAELLQSKSEDALSKEMEHKEKQMVALGAKLVEQKSVQRTATEANQDEASENSILSTVATNVSAGFTEALKFAARFAGAPSDAISFLANTDFDFSKMSPEERAQTIAEWQAEAITFGEMRAVLRRGGVATLDDEEARDEIMSADPFPTQPGGNRDPNALPPEDEDETEGDE